MLVYLLQRLTNALIERMNVSTEQHVLTLTEATFANVLQRLQDGFALKVSD